MTDQNLPQVLVGTAAKSGRC